jgi:beta-lactamase regulating signal transducer with metallopeptidase domain
MPIDVNVIAQASAARIVDCLVGGSLIAVCAGLLSHATRRQDSGTKFAVWFSALMAIAAVPFLAGHWSNGAGFAARAASHAAITLPASWAIYFFAAWTVIAGWGLARVGAGLWHVHDLRRSSEPIELETLDSILRETVERHSAREVVLCVSDRVQVPTAIGLVRPAIVLPRWVMQELSPVELKQILLHELAHLRRWDDWTNLTQKVVQALFFFHPAVWWIERKISLEREMACDDAVLAETSSPRAYAECLAHLAEKTLIQRSIALAQAALGRMRQTSQRVAQILDSDRPASSSRGWKVAVPLVAGFAVVCGVGISRTPRLVAFRDGGVSRPVAKAVAAANFDAGIPISVPVIKAGFRVPAPPSQESSAIARGKARRVHSVSSPHRIENQAREVAEDISAPRIEDMIRLARFSAAQGFATQTVFVVVEGRAVDASDQMVYEIHMWQLMVFHPAVDSAGTKIPHKET